MKRYPSLQTINTLLSDVGLFAQLKHERDASGIRRELNKLKTILQQTKRRICSLKESTFLAENEPNELEKIRELRPKGPRKIWKQLKVGTYQEHLAGAFLARCAGCTLGAIVEGWPVEEMEKWASYIGDKFPPEDYWSRARFPDYLRYGTHYHDDYIRNRINGVPVDDDITYTLLGLIIAEKVGLNFTTTDVGRVWQKLLPIACTAEEVALKNLKRGVAAEKAGEINNPYCEWIGAAIRADPWGYIAPAWPEKAAELAWRDALLTHRRNGIYGEMFFAAAISAAFAVNDPLEAIQIGLTEIPAKCRLANDIKWAIKLAPKIGNYKQARAAVDKRFTGMHSVHTNNNACLVVFGLAIGGKNVTRVLGETIAMGMDNDCTAATAGSIVGAIVGKKGISPHWYKPFRNKIYSYMCGYPVFKINDLLNRFEKQAVRMLEGRK